MVVVKVCWSAAEKVSKLAERRAATKADGKAVEKADETVLSLVEQWAEMKETQKADEKGERMVAGWVVRMGASQAG